MLSFVILRCHSQKRLMGEKSHYFTFDQIKPLVPKARNYWCVKKFHPSLFQIPVDLGSYEFCGKATEPIYDVCSMSSECLWVRLGSV